MARRTVLLVLAALVLAALPRAGGSIARPDLSAYRGMGTWVDIYDHAQWQSVDRTVAAMASQGVRTLYLETANYRAKKDVVHPVGVDEFIDAAHANGMTIVAWYLPSLDNLARDLRRSLAAIDRVTPTGGRFDSFGLDIEASVVTDPTLRSQRLLKLSGEIRDAAGPTYPLGAIIPSPRGMRERPDYWPGFPYRNITQYYDVVLPMSYWTFRGTGASFAHDYIADNISIVRAQTGDATVPIHVIGGIADAAPRGEVRGMVRAARELGILGASLYDFSTSTAEDWREVRRMPVNPVESPSLPVAVGYARALGNIPGSDRTHPKEVFYRTGGLTGSRTLRFRVFGVQPEEVAILVNWRKLRDVVPTAAESWSRMRTTTIPGSFLHPSGTNFIAFVADGNYPDWSVWGVRQLTVT